MPGLEALFNRFDRDQDGQLNLREFKAVARIFHHERLRGPRLGEGRPAPYGSAEAEAWPAPARRRPDGLPQLRSAEQARVPKSMARARMIMVRLKAADEDQDGKLSKAEAPPPLKKRFDKIDSDKDGYLDAPEIKQAVKRLHRAMQSRSGKRPGEAQKPAGKKAKKIAAMKKAGEHPKKDAAKRKAARHKKKLAGEKSDREKRKTHAKKTAPGKKRVKEPEKEPPETD